MTKTRSLHSLRLLLLSATTSLCLAANVVFAQDLSALGGQEDDAPATDNAAQIAVGDEGPSDSQISARLNSLFGAIDGLQAVDIEVHDGIVELQGTVATRDLLDQSNNFANRIEGVVAVENRIDVDQNLSRRLDVTVERLRDGFLDFVALLPTIAVALAIVFLSWLLARLVTGWDRAFSKIASNPFIRNLIQQFVKAAIIVAGLVLALQILDATGLLGSIAGALGIFGLAVGFATRDTVENYIASILLSLRQPFEPRDYVSIDGEEGVVLRLTSRATILMSMDGNHIRIPNSIVYKSKITNFTRNPRRRFEFEVGVDTDLDLTAPRSIALQCLNSMPGILDDPAPQCLVHKLGDSSVVLKVRGWVDQQHADFVKVRSEALRIVKEAFDDADIVMPEPIYNVNVRRGAKRGPKRSSAVRNQQNAAAVDGTVEIEITPDDSIQKQIDIDVAENKEEDLLDSSAPSE